MRNRIEYPLGVPWFGDDIEGNVAFACGFGDTEQNRELVAAYYKLFPPRPQVNGVGLFLETVSHEVLSNSAKFSE